jgi:hypothetical protein
MRDHIERLVGMKEHGLAAPNGIPDIEPALGQRKLDRVLRPISQSRVRHGAVKLQEIGKSGKTFSRIEILRAKLELLDRLMQQLAGFARPFVFGAFQFLSQLLECCTIENIAYCWKHLAFLFLLGMMFHIIVQNFQFCFELAPPGVALLNSRSRVFTCLCSSIDSKTIFFNSWCSWRAG